MFILRMRSGLKVGGAGRTVLRSLGTSTSLHLAEAKVALSRSGMMMVKKRKVISATKAWGMGRFRVLRLRARCWKRSRLEASSSRTMCRHTS